MTHTKLKTKKLGFMWETRDPFLFCVHHKDAYPKGNEKMGPATSLAGRDLGNDFQHPSGWSMYHGEEVPGFPVHPHRGFETVTVVLKGIVDHADSMGASGRYGAGDVQWMTAGSGCQHTEMFPLINQDKENPVELFQIWLNLPARDKFIAPHYKMLWAEDVPIIETIDSSGKSSTVQLVSGSFQGVKSLDPSPGSWANEENNHVNIMIIRMDSDAVLELPEVSGSLNRTLYYYEGQDAVINGVTVGAAHSVELPGDQVISLKNGSKESRFLLLEAEPIGEPVVKHGPFVMNTSQQISEAYGDYKATQFGGWPWERDDQIHPRAKGRFARYSDGVVEERK